MLTFIFLVSTAGAITTSHVAEQGKAQADFTFRGQRAFLQADQSGKLHTNIAFDESSQVIPLLATAILQKEGYEVRLASDPYHNYDEWRDAYMPDTKAKLLIWCSVAIVVFCVGCLFGSACKNRGSNKSSTNVMNLVPPSSSERPSKVLGVTGKDAEKFDEAFVSMEKMNIQAFVDLLNSENNLEECQLEDVPSHPWAEKPSCVGALAAAQLGVIALRDASNVPTIRGAGACNLLVRCLQPECPKDKRDYGVLLMGLMTSDPDSCAELGQKNVLPELLQILADNQNHRGLRCAISSILVNILHEHHGAASRFINEDGAEKLVQACEPFDCAPGDESFFLEIIVNILDLTEPDHDTGATSKFLPSIRNAVKANPLTLKSLADKYKGIELEATVKVLMERVA